MTLSHFDHLETRRLLSSATGSVVGEAFFDWNTNGADDEAWVYGDNNHNGIAYQPFLRPGYSVVLDLDSDGVAEPGEPVASAGYSTGFAYRFDNVTPGDYQLLLPSGAASTARSVEVTAGATTNVPKFAITLDTALVTDRRISGTVYDDRDWDGSRRADWIDVGLSGWTVFADLNGNQLPDSNEPMTRTDLNGRFMLRNVPAGDVTVRHVLQAGWSTLAASVVVPPGATWTDLQVYKLPTGHGAIRGPGGFEDQDWDGKRDSWPMPEGGGIGDVYLDLNNDGANQPDEPWATLPNYDNPGSSFHLFGPVAAGRYTLRVSRVSAGETILPARSIEIDVVDGQITTLPHFIRISETYRPNNYIRAYAYRDDDGTGEWRNGLNYVFAERIFIDLNTNGGFDVGEPSVTDGGFAEFTGIAPGTYQIGVIAPDSLVATGALLKTVTVTADDPGFATFGFLDNANFVRGRVYVDANGNNSFDAGETGVPNILVFNDENNNGIRDNDIVTPTDVIRGEYMGFTEENGSYVFPRWTLQTPTVNIRAVLPPALAQTYPFNQAGYTIGTTAPLASKLSLSDAMVAMASSTVSRVLLNADFAVKLNASAPASISGRTYNDNNANGIFDTGDVLITGKTVFLDANNNNKLDTGEKSVKSNSSGAYSFTGLAAGTYFVRRVFPTGYKPSNPLRDYTLVAGQAITGADIGSVTTSTVVTPPGDNPPPPPPPAQYGAISGVLYNDNNANGVYDTGDSPIARTVFLDANNNDKLDSGEKSMTSAADGRFTFTNLAAGAYFVRRVFPSGYKPSNPLRDYTLAAGQMITGADIGSVTSSTVVTPPGDNPPPPPPPPGDTGSISGFLFWDSNRNARFDTGETYQAAKTVFIDLDDDNILDSNERKLTSDAQGRFRFDGLTAGTYIVKRVVASGYKITTPKQIVTLGAGQVFSSVAIGTNTN